MLLRSVRGLFYFCGVVFSVLLPSFSFAREGFYQDQWKGLSQGLDAEYKRAQAEIASHNIMQLQSLCLISNVDLGLCYDADPTKTSQEELRQYIEKFGVEQIFEVYQSECELGSQFISGEQASANCQKNENLEEIFLVQRRKDKENPIIFKFAFYREITGIEISEVWNQFGLSAGIDSSEVTYLEQTLTNYSNSITFTTFDHRTGVFVDVGVGLNSIETEPNVIGASTPDLLSRIDSFLSIGDDCTKIKAEASDSMGLSFREGTAPVVRGSKVKTDGYGLMLEITRKIGCR